MTVHLWQELGEDERWSNLNGTCPHHPAEVVLTVSTPDGVRPFQSCDAEYVGYVPTEAEREASRGTVMENAWSVSGAADGDVPHFRTRIRCPKPSCNFEEQVRDDLMAVLYDMVRRQWHQGVADSTEDLGVLIRVASLVRKRSTMP